MFPSIVDVAGINGISRLIFTRAADGHLVQQPGGALVVGPGRLVAVALDQQASLVLCVGTVSLGTTLVWRSLVHVEPRGERYT